MAVKFHLLNNRKTLYESNICYILLGYSFQSRPICNSHELGALAHIKKKVFDLKRKQD